MVLAWFFGRSRLLDFAFQKIFRECPTVSPHFGPDNLLSSLDKSVLADQTHDWVPAVKLPFSGSFQLSVAGISLAYCCRMQIHEETLMTKFSSIVISVFLLSACATVTEDNGSQVAVQELPTPAAEIQPVESNAPTSAGPVREVSRKIPTKQEIKLIQAQ